MAKREFIEVNQLEKITLEDSLNYMEWHRDSEVDCAIVAPRLTEQDIIKPYLTKLKAKMFDLPKVEGKTYWDAVDDIGDMIDNLLSEQGDTE
jgi:hypothetical protein